MKGLWELDDMVFDRIVTDPAPTIDGLDVRKFLRQDGTTEDAYVYWFKREFRDNPPTTYPMVILQARGPTINVQRNSVEWTKVTNLETGNVTYQSAPDWMDFSYQLSCFGRTGRQFEELCWDVQRKIFSQEFGARWIDIDPPNEKRRDVTLKSIASAGLRREDVYRRDFVFMIQRIALFKLEELEVERTITELEVDFVFNDTGTGILVEYF